MAMTRTGAGWGLKMPVKVVINNRFGGFSLSKAAVAFIEAATNETVDEYFHTRHCEHLVRAVETLGDEADGFGSELLVVELKGNRYIIEEYDGIERALEPEDIRWIEVACKTQEDEV